MADYVVGSPALFNEDAKFFKDVYIYGKLYYDFESFSGTVSGTNITTEGNVTGSSASCTGNAATATTATNLFGGTLTNYAETINAIGVTSGAVSFTLFLTNDATAGRTITWPVSVKWPGGTISTRTTAASRTDVYTFFTTNNGTNWYGNIAQYNYA